MDRKGAIVCCEDCKELKNTSMHDLCFISFYEARRISQTDPGVKRVGL